MILSAHLTKLINFLQEDLAIPSSSVSIGLKQIEHNSGPLPIILWQHGLVTIEQLDRIYDWMESA